MDELIDILSPDEEKLGKTALKSEAHKKGWFHNTVHIWFYTIDKKILLQKRAQTKLTFPGLWDVSVAGHVHAGESIKHAAFREIKEEIGLHSNQYQLNKITVRKSEIVHENGIIDNEFHHVFIAELLFDISDIIMQEEEVESIELFDLSVLTKAKNLENILISRFQEYYYFIYDAIHSFAFSKK